MKHNHYTYILEYREYPKFPHDIGKEISKLVIVAEIQGFKKVMYLLKCSCGNEILRHRDDLMSRMKRGAIQSCGCSNRNSPGKNRKKHRLYGIWLGIRKRCNSPNDKAYPDYGGRGIKICNEWDDYRIFYNWAISHGYKKNLTIDRVNNDKGYSPDNCRWATMKEQSGNTRRNSRFLINGEWIIQSDLARKLGVVPATVMYMAKHGKLKYDKWIRK